MYVVPACASETLEKVSRPAALYPPVCPMENKEAYASGCLGTFFPVVFLDIHMRSFEKPWDENYTQEPKAV